MHFTSLNQINMRISYYIIHVVKFTGVIEMNIKTNTKIQT